MAALAQPPTLKARLIAAYEPAAIRGRASEMRLAGAANFLYDTNMKKRIRVRRNRRGRPATGHDPAVSIRLSKDLMGTLDQWASENGPLSRSEAVRRLVELGVWNERQPKSRPALSKEGFLSPSISEWIKRHRVANRRWFGLAEDLNRVAMGLLPSLTLPPEDNNVFLAVLLFLRGLSSFQGALLLAERGMTQDARTLARGCFENVFLMGALCRDPSFAAAFVGDDSLHRAKIAKTLLKLPNGSGLNAEQIERLTRFMSNFENSGMSAKPVNIADAARSAGLIDIYDTYYRGLSTDASHASVTALNRYVEADERSMIVGLRWGPEVSDVQNTLRDVCTAAIYSIVLISESCGLDDLENRMGACWADYKKLIEAQSREAEADMRASAARRA
jgi:hypothetical protein